MKSVASSGRTVLYVSHNMFSVKQLCNRAIFLDKGHLSYSGDTEDVIDYYLNRESAVKFEEKYEDRPSEAAQFTSFRIVDGKGKASGEIRINEPWCVDIEYKVRKMCPGTIVAIEILDEEGQALYMTSDSDQKNRLEPLKIGSYSARVPLGDVKLVPGTYLIRISIQSPSKIVYDQYEDIVVRILQDARDIRETYFKGKYMGYLANKIDWAVDKV